MYVQTRKIIYVNSLNDKTYFFKFEIKVTKNKPGNKKAKLI